MTILEWILMFLIAGLIGAMGQALGGQPRGGWLVAIAVGFVGALVGTWLSRLTSVPQLFSIQIGATVFPIVWSIIGAALFVAVLRLVTGRGRAF